ncbi:mitochondrial carrier domain-containing protein [Massariosphaeria phaeospora]|uniref:Mitochondrial carrier domain-containing protein n=1 Tax=Massariosphaeria phaeospora TaxID=100035 RepID=A0A7C8M7W7_9PLEO|nr:mitochondrial carrier domain-containing protein [Massariosphaeria phaeospora]
MQQDPAPHSRKTVPRSSAHLLAGASGGLATAIITSPLDVLRTRLQSDYYHLLSRPIQTVYPPFAPAPTHLLGASLRHLRETFQIINSVRYTEGWRGFFRGLGPSLAGVVPATAIKFYVYGNCKRLGAHVLGCGEDAAIVHAQAAVAAGIATSTATNPIWLVKTRLQLDKSRGQTGPGTARQYKNSLDCVRQVLRQEGIRGLYRGLSASYLGTVETALHLVLYERLKMLYSRVLGGINLQNSTGRDELIKWVSTSGAAGSSKLAAVLMTYPHEVVRTRLRQAPKENGVPKYAGLLQCFRLIGRQEGLIGLYGGLTPHIMRAIPSSVITLGVYEFVLRLVES